MRVSPRLSALVVALVLPVATACSHPPADATPEGALRLFLDDMDDSDDKENTTGSETSRQ